MKELKLGVYRHYKGGEYLIEKVARHSETDEMMVVYKTLYGDYSWWVRPLAMFFESVEFDGKSVLRFQWVRDK